MKEIVVLSGKGGTGKSSIITVLFDYFKKSVIADCDIDASNLNTFYNTKPFEVINCNIGNSSAKEKNECIGCKKCIEVCRFNALEFNNKTRKVKVLEYFCTGCEMCTYVCPVDAIYIKKDKKAQINLSKINDKYLVYSNLNPGQKGSGRLVSLIRQKAQDLCLNNNLKYIFIDGSPGIGCQVISSAIGTNLILLVVEPNTASISDMLRLYEVIKNFNIKINLIINKFDINLELCENINKFCNQKNIQVIGKIPFKNEIIKLLNDRKLMTENNEIKKIFKDLVKKLNENLNI